MSLAAKRRSMLGTRSLIASATHRLIADLRSIDSLKVTSESDWEVLVPSSSGLAEVMESLFFLPLLLLLLFLALLFAAASLGLRVSVAALLSALIVEGPCCISVLSSFTTESRCARFSGSSRNATAQKVAGTVLACEAQSTASSKLGSTSAGRLALSIEGEKLVRND